MNELLDLLHPTLFGSMTMLFFFQAIILMLRSNGNKARRILAYVAFAWGICYLLRFVAIQSPDDDFAQSYSLLRSRVMVVGNFYIALMYLFPIEALLPGWLNRKRFLLLYLPIVAYTGLYYLVLALLGAEPLELHTYAELWANIGSFDVWYRFVLLICNTVYIIAILMWLTRYESRYNQWKNNNFADQEYMDVSWMKAYMLFIVLIFGAFLFGLFYGSKLPVFIHGAVVAVAFSYIFYKGLFYESPYPEDFFKDMKFPPPYEIGKC